jgi:hypothetical protein
MVDEYLGDGWIAVVKAYLQFEKMMGYGIGEKGVCDTHLHV